MKKKQDFSRRAFIVFNYVFCILIGLLCVMPVVHILAVSLSSYGAVFSGHVSFWPVDFTLDNYRIVVRDAQFLTSFLVSIRRAALGWAISITLTVLAAYPMSLKRGVFPGRPFFVCLFMGSMLFYGGMIPSYLVVYRIGILNTMWALVLPTAVSTYNIILMMNFMKGLPEALSEAAYIDGAGHVRTLFTIILPLSLPSLATITLFIVLAHWNAWFDGMIYIKVGALKPLQTYLRSVIIDNASLEYDGNLEQVMINISSDGANGAKIFIALLPILCIYPFVQKHFAKGIVRGSVKE